MTDKRSPEQLAGHDPLLSDALSERTTEQPAEPVRAPEPGPAEPATPFRFQVRTVPPGWLQNALGVFRRVTPAGGLHKIKPNTLPGLGKQELTPAAPATVVVDDPQRHVDTAPTPTLSRRARQRKQLAVAGLCALIVIAVAIWLTPSGPTRDRAAPSQPAAAANAELPATAPPQPTASAVAPEPPSAASTASAPATEPTSPPLTAPRAAPSAKPRATARKKSQDPDRPFF